MSETSRRIKERLRLSLPLRVRCYESADYEWVEMSRLLDVTAFGAGFTISRPTEPGRLLHLTLPMPRQLRCFDHVEDQYRIWALVRHTMSLEPTGENRLSFKIGVAFVGKRPPASYERDPARRYEIASSALDSNLWSVRELPDRSDKAGGTSSGRQETETRFSIPIAVTIESLEMGQTNARESTVTENISICGACVYTALKVNPGRFIRITSTQYRTTVIAAVRGRHTGADGMTRLHLEFIDRQWPLEGIEQS